MNRQESSSKIKNQSNTIGDFLSEELKKKIKNAAKEKNTNKENNKKAVGNK
tara:strand:+ start:585 stop:737 length:153 start_codon:yes stop_codon:yes gene_type:complete